MVNIRQNQTRQCTICVVDFPIETSLAGGFTILKNIVNGKDYPIYYGK
jgi:hypothetical protein